MKSIVYLLLSLTVYSVSFAAPIAPQGDIKSPAIVAASPSPQRELEVKLLEQQIATMKEYHSSLLDTVYWALGTVATVSMLLVGFGWLANFKFHESEKKRLMDELDAKLKEAFSSIETRLSTREIEVIKSVDLRLENQATRTTRDIDIARTEATKQHENNSAAIEQMRVKISDLDAAQAKGKKRDSEIEATLRNVEEGVWEIKGIPTNILITQAQGLRASLDAEQNRFYIVSTLQRMRKTIEDLILPTGKTVPKQIIDGIKEDVAKVATIEPVEATAVSLLLEKIQIEARDRKQ